MIGMWRKNLKSISFVYRITWVVILLLAVTGLLLNLSTTAYANDRKVADNSDLLTSEEESSLQERLMEISDKYQCDVIAATTDSFEGQDRWDYTDEFYNENAYGYGDTIDGIILMVNLPEREFQYLTRGTAIDVFTDYGLEVIDEQVTPYLSDGAFFEAFMEYADLAEEFLYEAAADRPYDVNHTYDQSVAGNVYDERIAGNDYDADLPNDQKADLNDGEYGYDQNRRYDSDDRDYRYGQEQMNNSYVRDDTYGRKLSASAHIGIAAGVGLVVTVIVLLVLLGQLRTVRAKGQARDYVRSGSFRVTGARDVFLYRTVTRHRIERDNNGPGGSSTRPSSGGGRSGGRGGSF